MYLIYLLFLAMTSSNWKGNDAIYNIISATRKGCFISALSKQLSMPYSNMAPAIINKNIINSIIPPCKVFLCLI